MWRGLKRCVTVTPGSILRQTTGDTTQNSSMFSSKLQHMYLPVEIIPWTCNLDQSKVTYYDVWHTHVASERGKLHHCGINAGIKWDYVPLSSTKPPWLHWYENKNKKHSVFQQQSPGPSLLLKRNPPKQASLRRADSPLERRTMFSRKVFCGATSPLFPPGILLRAGGAGVGQGLWRCVCCSVVGTDAGSQSDRWRSSL